MAEASNIWAVIALCAMSGATGYFVSNSQQASAVSEAKTDALRLRDANEALVKEKAKAESQRDYWRSQAKTERGEIYAGDEEARSWGATPIPPALRQRVQDAARSTDAAAAAGSERRR